MNELFIKEVERLLKETLDTDAIKLCGMYSMQVDDKKVAESIKDSFIEKHRNYLWLLNNYKMTYRPKQLKQFIVEITLYQFMEFVDVALYNNDCSDLDSILKSQVKQFYPNMNVKDVLYALVINQMKKTLE